MPTGQGRAQPSLRRAGAARASLPAADRLRAATPALRFATYLAPGLRPLYEHVAAACGASSLVSGRDWRELASGDIDAAFVCSPPLVWLEGAVEAIAAPVLTDDRFGGEPLYSSEVVVRAESRFRSLADLAGARWAVNEPSSWSGYWVTLARVGEWSYFGQVVDGSAIDCQVLAMELRQRPELADRIRVVASLGPSPIQPVVVRSSLAAGLRSDLCERLLSLGGPVLEHHFVRRFVAPPSYAPVAAELSRRPRPGAPARSGA
ncbi:MAG: hypothetical protein E6I85_00755 [Chloroflexi bacterium]|nr:MAG: hypothetical protein E6I85_00755 [Chloroflexota bacterium]